MADSVSQVFALSSAEAALVATIKQILDEDTVETIAFRWGEKYKSERLTSATDELKTEISKRLTLEGLTVDGVAVSKFNKGVRMHQDTIIIALEPLNLTTKSGTSITSLSGGSYVKIFGDPLLFSSDGDRDHADAVVVVLHGEVRRGP